MPDANVRCPACNSASTRSTGPRAPAFSTIVANAEFKQSAYAVIECANCGLLYRFPTLSSEELSRYYSAIDFRGWETAGYFPTESCLIQILQRLPKGKRLLDFGCSSGRLLAGFCRDYDCYGIELNELAAAAAATKGIKMIRPNDWQNQSLPSFDAIILVDVFEHLTEPLTTLKDLRRLLLPGGWLIIATGNGDAAACRRDPAQFWYFRHIEHVSMLTRKHAQYLCQNLQLELKDWIGLCHYDLSWREKLVQVLQNFAYWQFRRRTWLARHLLRHLPGMRALKTGTIAPTYNCSRDHVLAVFVDPMERVHTPHRR